MVISAVYHHQLRCSFNGIRAILHDKKLYPDPFNFVPERFMQRQDGQQPKDPQEFSFGYGRRSVPRSITPFTMLTPHNICRACPGRHFADSMLWLMMVQIVSAFHLARATDEDGNTLEPTGRYTSGLVTWVQQFSSHLWFSTPFSFSRPEPFLCTFTPRLPEVIMTQDWALDYVLVPRLLVSMIAMLSRSWHLSISWSEVSMFKNQESTPLYLRGQCERCKRRVQNWMAVHFSVPVERICIALAACGQFQLSIVASNEIYRLRRLLKPASRIARRAES